MNVASVAPSRNHLIDSKQATHRLRRHLDGVFEGLGVRPCVLDDAIGTRDGDALVASARAVGGPQIEQHVEAIGPAFSMRAPGTASSARAYASMASLRRPVAASAASRTAEAAAM